MFALELIISLLALGGLSGTIRGFFMVLSNNYRLRRTGAIVMAFGFVLFVSVSLLISGMS